MNFQFENTLNVDWRGYVGMEYLQLKTDAGNIYGPLYVGGSTANGTYRPGLTIIKDELYIFQMAHKF